MSTATADEIVIDDIGPVEHLAIPLPAGTRGRYVWIRQTGERKNAWSVAELAVE